jgi:toxin ParE1/3/4
MSRALITRQAREDLLAIWPTSRRTIPPPPTGCWTPSTGAARRWPTTPRSARPDIAPKLRSSPVGSYLILYRQVAAGVEVVRVLHGARNLRAIFQAED